MKRSAVIAIVIAMGLSGCSQQDDADCISEDVHCITTTDAREQADAAEAQGKRAGEALAGKYYDEGKRVGLQIGLENGLAEGRKQGVAEGLAQGQAAGRAEGLVEGRAQGRATGRIEGFNQARSPGRAAFDRKADTTLRSWGVVGLFQVLLAALAFCLTLACKGSDPIPAAAKSAMILVGALVAIPLTRQFGPPGGLADLLLARQPSDAWPFVLLVVASFATFAILAGGRLTTGRVTNDFWRLVLVFGVSLASTAFGLIVWSVLKAAPDYGGYLTWSLLGGASIGTTFYATKWVMDRYRSRLGFYASLRPAARDSTSEFGDPTRL